MKLKSFKYLKETGGCGENSPLKDNSGAAENNDKLKVGIVGGDEKSVTETFFGDGEKKGNQSEKDEKDKILVDSFDNDGAYFSPVQIVEKSKLSSNSSLMVTGFCYGCLRFSVTAPGTKLEMGFCKRVNKKTGETIFKRILSDISIRQCKRRLNENGSQRRI